MPQVEIGANGPTILNGNKAASASTANDRPYENGEVNGGYKHEASNGRIEHAGAVDSQSTTPVRNF